MLTAMTEDDWAIVLQVFRAVRSRRGDKGRDDRKFLEALHYFTVHNITWRALSAEFGHWNSIWKRFWRLSRAGIFEAFFDALAALSESAHLVQMFDSTVARAHVSAAGAKGGQDDQALGRSRGGFSTKIHLKVDLDGLPLAFHLTGGEASDSRNFELLLDIGPDILPRAAITDKGYDAKSNRDGARKRGICPVIPHRATATDRPAFFPKILYKARARIEQAVGKLKRFKRIALRCEKTARNYGSFVALAITFTSNSNSHRPDILPRPPSPQSTPNPTTPTHSVIPSRLQPTDPLSSRKSSTKRGRASSRPSANSSASSASPFVARRLRAITVPSSRSPSASS